MAKQQRTPQILLALILMISSAAFFRCASQGGDDTTGPTGEDLELSSATLPLAIVGASYSVDVSPSGGINPYAYTSSNLPSGLILIDNDTSFTVTGAPTQAGTDTFSVTVDDDAGSQVTADFTMMVVDALDLTGTWSFSITVTNEEGVCSGETGQTDTTVIEIVQTGNDIIATGWQGDPTNELTGQLHTSGFESIRFEGCYPEDGGTTRSRHYLTLYTPNEMEGREDWDWWDEVNPQFCPPQSVSDCPDGAATVTAVR